MNYANNISQGSVAERVRCGGSDHFIANLVFNIVLNDECMTNDMTNFLSQSSDHLMMLLCAVTSSVGKRGECSFWTRMHLSFCRRKYE